MIELEKGDPNNLEGKVLVYAINTCIWQPKFPFMEGYGKVIPFDESYLSGILDEFPQINKDEKVIVDIYAKKYLTFKEKQLNETIDKFNNVHNAGKVKDLLTAAYKLNVALVTYFSDYTKQLSEKKEKEISKEKEEITDHYKNYDGAGLRERLHHFSGILMNSINKKNMENQTRIVNEFKHFVKDSNFPQNIDAIIKLARSNRKDKLNLINLYIEKTVAIYTQNFEKAAEYKKKIEVLE